MKSHCHLQILNSTTAYTVNMNENVECKALCDKLTWEGPASSEVSYRISHEYFIHLIIDNLPCATQFTMPDTHEVQYEPGSVAIHVQHVELC
jgi:transmembrane 9 superfamily protein 2/4